MNATVIPIGPDKHIILELPPIRMQWDIYAWSLVISSCGSSPGFGPLIGPNRDAIRERLATALQSSVDAISVKGKTNEGMGWIGREEGLAVMCVATLVRA